MSLRSFFTAIDAEVAKLVDGWDSIPVGDEFSVLRGELAHEPVEMRTSAYGCPSVARLAWVRMDTIDGKPVTRTMVALPRGAGTIVGLDVVALKNRVSLFAVDLRGTNAEATVAADATLGVGRTKLRGFTDRPRPQFVEGAFSDHAIIGGFEEGAEESGIDCVRIALGRVALQTCPGKAEDDRAVVLNWLDAERRNRKERNALARMFGVDRAESYLERFLFSASAAA